MSKNAPSRRKQKCGECDEEYSNYQNLKIHFTRAHPGKLVRTKGQTGLNFLSSAAPPAKRTHDEAEAESTKSAKDAETTDQGSTSYLETSEPMDTTSTEKSRSSAPDSNLLVELQSVIDKYRNLEITSHPPVKDAALPGEIDNSEIVNRLKVCASLRDFENIVADSFVLDRNTETIRCRICVPDSTTTTQYNLSGVFTTENVEHVREDVQSLHLRHLKNHILTHLKSATHLKNSEEKVREMQVQKSIHNRNREIGRKVGSESRLKS